MTEIASAYISILPSMKGFSTKLNGQVGGDVEKAGKTSGSRFGKVFATASIKPFRAFGAAALGFFAVDKVKDFFGSAIDEARESQKVSALTAQVIKTTGGAANISAAQIGNLSQAISNKVGIDDEAIQSGANMLLTFTNVRNEVGKGNKVFNEATRLATDMSAALGGDAKSAALQLGKALNDPAKGVTKLARSGVSFTEQQVEQIKAMQKAGDVLGAQKIILGEVSKEFGGAAAASATSGEKMSVAWGNLKEQIGTALLPVLDKVETFMTARAIPAVSNFLTQFQNDQGGPGKLRDALTQLYNGGTSVIGWMNSNRGVVASFLAAFAAYKTVNLFTGAFKALNLVMKANTLGLVVAGVAAVAAGLIYAYKHSETFRNIVNGAFSAVKRAGSAMWDTLKSIFRFLVNTWLTVAGAIVNGAAKAFGWVPGIGGKLKAAAANFNTFRDQVNASLNGIHKDVSVTVTATLRNTTFYQALTSKGGKKKSSHAPLILAPRAATAGDLGGISPRLAATAGREATTAGFDAARKAAQHSAPKVKSQLKKHLESIIAMIGDGLSGKKDQKTIAKVKASLGKLTDSIKKQLDNQLQVAKDKVKAISDRISSLKDAIAQTASSVAQNYLPDFTTNALFGPDGKMIKGTAVSSFKGQVAGKGGILSQVTAAYNKLLGEGLNGDFLASLLQSGQTNLVLDLGQASRTDALSAQLVYQNVTKQANDLGEAVASHTVAAQQKVEAVKAKAQADKEAARAKERKDHNDRIANKLDHQLDHLKKLDTLSADIVRGINRSIAGANQGRRS